MMQEDIKEEVQIKRKEKASGSKAHNCHVPQTLISGTQISLTLTLNTHFAAS